VFLSREPRSPSWCSTVQPRKNNTVTSFRLIRQERRKRGSKPPPGSRLPLVWLATLKQRFVISALTAPAGYIAQRVAAARRFFRCFARPRFLTRGRASVASFARIIRDLRARSTNGACRCKRAYARARARKYDKARGESELEKCPRGVLSKCRRVALKLITHHGNAVRNVPLMRGFARGSDVIFPRLAETPEGFLAATSDSIPLASSGDNRAADAGIIRD